MAALFLERVENRVGDGGGFDGGADVVDADDRSSGEDGCGGGGDGGVGATVDGNVVGSCGGGDGASEERFARDAGEQRRSEREQIVEVGEERVVVVVNLAEAVAGVEDDAVAFDAEGVGAREGLDEIGLNERNDGIGREARLGAPFVGASAGVHENDAAAGAGAGAAHVGIPRQGTDVVDDFRAGSGSGGGGAGFVGVDGEDGVGAFAKNGFDDGEDAILFVFRAEALGAGARGFAADVDEVGSVVEHGERVFGGDVRAKVEAAVRERVRRNVEHAHDESARAERQSARADLPGGEGATGKRHRERCYTPEKLRGGEHVTLSWLAEA